MYEQVIYVYSWGADLRLLSEERYFFHKEAVSFTEYCAASCIYPHCHSTVQYNIVQHHVCIYLHVRNVKKGR